MDKNKYHMLWFLGASLFSVFIFYWVFTEASHYFSTGYIEYSMKGHITLHGTSAIVAYSAALIIGFLSAALAIYHYKKFISGGKKIIKRR